MNKKDIIYSFLVGVELYARLFLSAGALVVLAIVGGLATIGGGEMETSNPDAFDGLLGGYEFLYFIMDVYIQLIWIIPLYIIVAGREKSIYNTVKKFIIDRKEKKPINKRKLKWMIIFSALYFTGYYIGSFFDLF